MKEQLNLFLEGSQQFLNQVAVSLPRIIGALLLLIIGWIIAKLIKKLVVKGLKAIKIPYLTEKAGIDKFLKEGGINVTAIDVIGTLIYWIIMLVVILATLNSINLTSASTLFNQIMLFIPNIVVALLVLIIGIYLAKFVSQIVSTSLTSMKSVGSETISKIAYYTIIVLTVFIILSQLNIASEIVTSAFVILFGAICLALALAFGIGGREWASDIIKKYFK
jgi:hypothetical protein